MNDQDFDIIDRNTQPEATFSRVAATKPAGYASPDIADLGKAAELVQGYMEGGFPDGYTGYRKTYW